jgi:hypothetical protein
MALLLQGTTMKFNTVVLFAVLALPVAAHAEWVSLGKNVSGSEFFIDWKTLKSGQKPRAWFMTDFGDKSDGIGSERALQEADCRDDKVRRLQTTEYSDGMGGGQTLGTTESTKWVYAAPGTMLEVVLNALCQKK